MRDSFCHPRFRENLGFFLYHPSKNYRFALFRKNMFFPGFTVDNFISSREKVGEGHVPPIKLVFQKADLVLQGTE